MRKATKTMLRGLNPRPYVWYSKTDLACGADWAAQVTEECQYDGDVTDPKAILRPGDWLIWRSDVRRLVYYTDKDFHKIYTPMGEWDEPEGL